MFLRKWWKNTLSAKAESVSDAMHRFPAAKRITCVLYQGGGAKLLESLEERGYTQSHLFFARGKIMGESESLPVAFAVPKEVVVVLCPEDQADDLFTWIWERERIGEPARGFLYMTSVASVTGDIPVKSEA